MSTFRFALAEKHWTLYPVLGWWRARDLRYHRYRMRSFALTAVLLALLPLLAVLQYRWIGQLSNAERERMQVNVRVASSHFARAFDGELTRAAVAFLVFPPTLDHGWDRFAERYEMWLGSSPRTGLVRAVYALEKDEDAPVRLLRANPGAARFDPAEWDARFDALRKRLERRVPRPQGRRAPFEWTVEEEIPALVLWLPRAMPMFGFHSPAVQGTPGARAPRLRGCLVVELDLGYIRGELLPELARRHFADLYHVAVVSRAQPNTVIYSSPADLPLSAFSPPDAAEETLALRPEGGHTPPHFPDDMGPLRRGAAMRAFLPVAGQWRVLVRHPAGSLESAVQSIRQRNLAISFGILLLLGATVATIVVSTRRAQNLARLQMEFVAGVSHELLTPLSVIRSAADNLADGLVEGRPQVGKYGDLIRRESRGLSEMVRQTLDYASLQYQRRRYDFKPLDAAEVIRQALESCTYAIKESGVEMVEEIEPDLPPVTGDAGALTLSVRNLVTNALKYGKNGGRVEIAARRVVAERNGGVEIAVIDRGPGIDPADLPHVFEPFYRGREAAASHTHGTGLGLGLVKRIVEDHGGRVAVKSVRGQGSVFTIRIPASRQVRA